VQVAIKGLVLNKNTGEIACKNKARRTSDQRSAEVEVKVLRDVLNTSGAGRQPPGIVPILNSFYSKNFLFVVTPWIDGGDLYEHLNAVADSEVGNKMELELMARWFCDIAASLAIVHKKGYAHRDVSPENVLITRDKSVKIHDFGLACNAAPQNSAEGKVLYAAPEIFTASRKSYDPRAADIWSLAILFLSMLTKHTLFRSALKNNPRFQMYCADPRRMVDSLLKELKLDDRITKEAIDLFLRMAKEDPAERLNIEEVLRHPFVLRHGKKSRVVHSPRKLLARSQSMPCQIRRACEEFIGNLLQKRLNQ